MKATVYTGLACTWCDRVKSLLKDNDYEIEEIVVNKTILEELQTKYDKVGGYHEVEDRMKGTTSVNKI